MRIHVIKPLQLQNSTIFLEFESLVVLWTCFSLQTHLFSLCHFVSIYFVYLSQIQTEYYLLYCCELAFNSLLFSVFCWWMVVTMDFIHLLLFDITNLRMIIIVITIIWTLLTLTQNILYRSIIFGLYVCKYVHRSRCQQNGQLQEWCPGKLDSGVYVQG